MARWQERTSPENLPAPAQEGTNVQRSPNWLTIEGRQYWSGVSAPVYLAIEFVVDKTLTSGNIASCEMRTSPIGISKVFSGQARKEKSEEEFYILFACCSFGPV